MMAVIFIQNYVTLTFSLYYYLTFNGSYGDYGVINISKFSTDSEQRQQYFKHYSEFMSLVILENLCKRKDQI